MDRADSLVEDYTFDNMNRIDIQRHYALDNGSVNMTTPFLRTEFDYTYRADGQKTGLTEKEVLGGQTRTSTTSWAYDNAGRLTSEIIDHWDNNADQTESYVLDLFGNRVSRTVNKPSTPYVDQFFSYLYNANDQVTSETLDNGIVPGVDQTSTYGWTNTQQTSKSVSVPSVSTVTQAMTYGLSGQLERVVTTTQNGSGTVTGRSRVDYRSNTQGIRTISVDWNDANLDGTFAAGERTGSIEYLIDNSNFTGYQQTILEVTKNAAGQATKRISYTFGTDEITQTVSTLNASTGVVTGTQTQTFGHDGRGSVQVLFDASAAIAQVYTYSAYGELIAIHNGAAAVVGTVGQANLESLASTNKLYNGEGFDTRTGLYNFRARNYSASLGRFERLDPFAGNPTDPFSFNKYGFVHGNPIGMTDPTGLFGLISGAFSISYNFTNRIGSAAASFAAKRGVEAFAQRVGFEVFRLQMHLLTHWWKYEMGLMAAVLTGEVTGAMVDWVDDAIDKSLANERLLEGANIGNEFEEVLGANGTKYQAIDHLINEPDGKIGVVSLGSVGTSPGKTDKQYIDKIAKALTEKGQRIANNRSFPMRDQSGPPLQANQVGTKVVVIAIQSDRSHVIANPQFRSMLHTVQNSMKNVKFVVTPLRGWIIKR